MRKKDKQRLMIGGAVVSLIFLITVVVVALVGKTGVQQLRRPAGDANRVQFASAVEQQRTAVARPVGRLEVRARPIHDTPPAGLYRDRLQRAFDNPIIHRI